MPLVVLGFFMMQLDRGNIANALTDTILQDLHITTDDVNVRYQLLSLGILLFEIPSNIILQRVRPLIKYFLMLDRRSGLDYRSDTPLGSRRSFTNVCHRQVYISPHWFPHRCPRSGFHSRFSVLPLNMVQDRGIRGPQYCFLLGQSRCQCPLRCDCFWNIVPVWSKRVSWLAMAFHVGRSHDCWNGYCLVVSP